MSKQALQLIEENKKTKSPALDLGNCGLTQFPKKLLDCVWLEELILCNKYWDWQKRKWIESENKGKPNKLSAIPAEINKIQKLKILKVGGEYDYVWSISDISFLEKLTGLQSLDLRDNKISDISFLEKLTGLQSLDLRSNQISDISFLEKLTGLQSLDLRDNKISDISFLEKLTGLQSLDLRYNKISDISFLEKLTGLQSLDLRYNKISDISFLEKLTGLQSLDLSDNKISDISFLEKLTGLQSLDLSDYQISDISFLEKLTGLQSLDLSYNKISDFRFLEKLTGLQFLYLSDNKISDISFLEKLTGLQSLDLRYNKISDISFLEKLTGLQSLDLRSNQISDPPLQFFESLELEPDIKEEFEFNKGKLYLYGNEIKNIPKEVLEQGRAFVLQHLRSKYKQPLNECKIIITGRGSVGKTSLQKRLFGPEQFDPGEKETHGIRKRCWADGVKAADNRNIKVNFWDMGGQQDQQTLHQLFYSENTVYILLLDKRTDENPEDFLELIKVYGNSSPVIIAINNKIDIEKQQPISYNLNPEFDSTLRVKYPNILETFGVCCGQDDDPGIIQLRNYLKDFLPGLTHVREQYPLPWLQIKDELLNRITKNYIQYDEYKKLCVANKVDEKEIQIGLARMLNNTGTITFFDKPFLGNYYILNPDWVTTGAYQIILSAVTAEKKGRINYNDLKKIFSEKLVYEYAEKDYEFLMNLLLVYDLCHEYKKGEEWLIPSSLKGQSNTDLVEYKKVDYRLYCIQYDISLPQSIMHRFIARNINYAYNRDYWRNGIVLKHPDSNTHLFAEADFKDKVIRLWIKGKEILEAWKFFRKDFTDLSQKFNYDEMVAVEENGIQMMSYKELVNLRKNLPDDQLENWYNPLLDLRVNVLKTLCLFDDIKEIEERREISDRRYIPGSVTIVKPQPSNKVKEEALKKQIEEFEKKEEDRMVSIWKKKAIYIFIVSLIITVILIWCYLNEYRFIMNEEQWKEFKKSVYLPLITVFLLSVWNLIIGKIFYDRILDHSKEKAYRDLLKSKR